MGQQKGGSGGSPVVYGGVILLSLVVVAVMTFAGTFPAGEDTFKIYLLVVALFIGGNVLFVAGFGKLRRLQLIKNTPTSKVRSIAMGLVEVYGKARQVEDDLLEAPFSGEQCLFYTYRVEEYKDAGDDKDWVTIASGREGTSFFLDDGTGRVMVDPRGADLKVPEDNEFFVDGGEQPPKHIQQFVEEREAIESEDKEVDLGLFDIDTGNDRRYHESFVTPGEQVYVFGEAMERPGEGSAENEENIVINRKERTPMFVISDESEKELVEDVSHMALALLASGPLLSIIGFGGMLLFLGFF